MQRSETDIYILSQHFGRISLLCMFWVDKGNWKKQTQTHKAAGSGDLFLFFSNINWFNLLFHCTRHVYTDLHGLKFETSPRFVQDQPGAQNTEATAKRN